MSPTRCTGCGLQLNPEWKACPACGAVRELERRQFRRSYVVVAAAAAVLLLIVAVVVVRDHSSKAKSHALRAVGASATPGASNALRGGASSSPSSSSSSSSAPGGSGSGLHNQATSSAVQRGPGPPPAMAFDGQGPKKTQRFTLISGLAVFRADCPKCRNAFAVELLDGSGATKDTLVNTTGPYNGSVGVGVQGGSYMLKVASDAPWSASVAEPRNTTAPDLPTTYRGRQQQFVGAFSAGSKIHLQAQNRGAGNFIVEVLSADGRVQDIAFNEKGDFNGSADATGLSGAPYYLNVNSGGTWSVTVSS